MRPRERLPYGKQGTTKIARHAARQTNVLETEPRFRLNKCRDLTNLFNFVIFSLINNLSIPTRKKMSFTNSMLFDILNFDVENYFDH